MNKVIVYIHGKGGSPAEAENYKRFFPDCDVIGFDYKSDAPWEAKEEFTAYFEEMHKRYAEISVIANSIGAFFIMNADVKNIIKNALFISPVVDMTKLILKMMSDCGITEEELCEKKEIETPFGITLIWEYLCYVRENPVNWTVPTNIIFGEFDQLTSLETVSAFAKKSGAVLDVIKGGEHSFYTDEQISTLENRLEKIQL